MRIGRRLMATLSSTIVISGLLALVPISQASASVLPAANGVAVRSQVTPTLDGPGPSGSGLCIDSTQLNNDKFVVFVPGTAGYGDPDNQLWIWKENRGGGGDVNPWVLFTKTEGKNPLPFDVFKLVCATVTAHDDKVAVTLVTLNETDQVMDVWQTDCTVGNDNAGDPFDPNQDCADLQALGNQFSGESGDGNGDSDESIAPPVTDPNGPNAGDGSTLSSGPGAATAAGGVLLGLAVTGGVIALRRRGLHRNATAA
ncbi:hypothetical protein ABZV93_22290 [Actinopolymorpha sp. NPDC004070]|uniref:hypothetical protein n=1 Tax=Actinopolymorpha sp. NPDC004070 TaxID=3154548 RepID=UPI0033BF3CA7